MYTFCSLFSSLLYFWAPFPVLGIMPSHLSPQLKDCMQYMMISLLTTTSLKATRSYNRYTVNYNYF